MLFECPYGHKAGFDSNTKKTGSIERTRVTCHACQRTFCVEVIHSEIRNNFGTGSTFDTRVVGYEHWRKVFEEDTPASRAKNEWIDGFFPGLRMMKFWTGTELHFFYDANDSPNDPANQIGA